MRQRPAGRPVDPTHTPGWIDPLGLVAELWRTAWTAGHRVGAVSPPGPTSGNIGSGDPS
jgi:hypothetical protein